MKEDEKKNHFLTRLLNRGAFIGDTDKSKVSNIFEPNIVQITLYINLTMNEKLQKENGKEMEGMKYLCNKYTDEMTVFGQFAYDV